MNLEFVFGYIFYLECIDFKMKCTIKSEKYNLKELKKWNKVFFMKVTGVPSGFLGQKVAKQRTPTLS